MAPGWAAYFLPNPPSRAATGRRWRCWGRARSRLCRQFALFEPCQAAVGAFAGLEKIIADRLQKRSIGFGAHVADPDKRRVGELLTKHFKLRMQKASGQLGQTHLLRAQRRDIARVKTVMGERERAASKQQKA